MDGWMDGERELERVGEREMERGGAGSHGNFKTESLTATLTYFPCLSALTTY